MRRDHGRVRIRVGWNLYRVFACWIVLGVLGASLGCAGLFWEDKPLQTRLMSKVGKTQMTAVELRSRVNELAVRIPGIIEKAADAIRETSTDPQVRRRALVWKIDAVPAVQRVLLQSDPWAAIVDGWVLGFQMLHYYAEEGGAALFGSSQSLAVQACRQSLAELDEVVNLVVQMSEIIPQARRNTEEWARQHPLEGNYFTRESVASDLERLVTRVVAPRAPASGTVARLWLVGGGDPLGLGAIVMAPTLRPPTGRLSTAEAPPRQEGKLVQPRQAKRRPRSSRKLLSPGIRGKRCRGSCAAG